MDREQIRTTLLDLLEQETWERPKVFGDAVKIREELKLDSVDLLGVMLRAEVQIGVTLDSRDFDKIATVGNLLDTIERKLAAKSQNRAA
ncbi:MAG: acyl carrier protein [Pirellulaceae bacterium]